MTPDAYEHSCHFNTTCTTHGPLGSKSVCTSLGNLLNCTCEAQQACFQASCQSSYNALGSSKTVLRACSICLKHTCSKTSLPTSFAAVYLKAETSTKAAIGYGAEHGHGRAEGDKAEKRVDQLAPGGFLYDYWDLAHRPPSPAGSWSNSPTPHSGCRSSHHSATDIEGMQALSHLAGLCHLESTCTAFTTHVIVPTRVAHQTSEANHTKLEAYFSARYSAQESVKVDSLALSVLKSCYDAVLHMFSMCKANYC